MSNTIASEINYAKGKYKDRYKVFNLETRKAFIMKSMSILIIKYAYDYNLYGLRETIINS